MPARSPEEVDALFEKTLNAGDMEGLVALYEPDATLIPQPGQEAKGHDAIRETLSPLVAGKAQIDLNREDGSFGRRAGGNIWNLDDEGGRRGDVRKDDRSRSPTAGRHMVVRYRRPVRQGLLADGSLAVKLRGAFCNATDTL